MIKNKTKESQETIWIQTDKLQVQPQINFYSKFSSILDSMKFGDMVRKFALPYYSPKKNVRPPLDPEFYFNASSTTKTSNNL